MKELECSQDFSHYKSMWIFPDTQGQLTPQSLVQPGRISNSSEMLWMSSLPASMKKIRSKTEALRVFKILYINFLDAQGQIILVLVVVSGQNFNSPKLSCMSSLPARMRMINSKMDAQVQLTPQSLVRSSRISNSSEILWMFLLPACMKKFRSKMKALECSQYFPHYNPMGAIGCHGHQSSNPIWPKT